MWELWGSSLATRCLSPVKSRVLLRSSCSGSHEAETCCLGGTQGGSTTDRAEQKTPVVEENPTSLVQFAFFSLTVNFTGTAIDSHTLRKTLHLFKFWRSRVSDKKLISGVTTSESGCIAQIPHSFMQYNQEFAQVAQHQRSKIFYTASQSFIWKRAVLIQITCFNAKWQKNRSFKSLKR